MNKDLEKQIEIIADKFADAEWRYSNGYVVAEAVKQYFIAGAKSKAAKQYWQQGMYTEEEVKDLLNKSHLARVKDPMLVLWVDKGLEFSPTWFEQNKKK